MSEQAISTAVATGIISFIRHAMENSPSGGPPTPGTCATCAHFNGSTCAKFYYLEHDRQPLIDVAENHEPAHHDKWSMRPNDPEMFGCIYWEAKP